MAYRSERRREVTAGLAAALFGLASAWMAHQFVRYDVPGESIRFTSWQSPGTVYFDAVLGLAGDTVVDWTWMMDPGDIRQFDSAARFVESLRDGFALDTNKDVISIELRLWDPWKSLAGGFPFQSRPTMNYLTVQTKQSVSEGWISWDGGPSLYYWPFFGNTLFYALASWCLWIGLRELGFWFGRRRQRTGFPVSALEAGLDNSTGASRPGPT